MADPAYPAFSIFSFIGFILVLIPLPWHLQAWNSGTCLFMIWTAIGCLNLFINSIVWHNNAIDWAPVWCDISTRLTIGISVAIPAASLCINRRLYKIASSNTVSLTRGHKRRAVMADLAIGLGIPFLQMLLQFIVQGHRYNIWEDYGCFPTTVNTPPAYPLTYVWPLVIGLTSAVYCIMTLRAFMKRRAQFSEFVSSNACLTVNRYFRLMSLATVELLFNTPLAAYGLYLNATITPIYSWKNWSDLHYDWYTIDTFPAVLWRWNRGQVVALELSRWSSVFCAMLFFAFFGFADESRKNYKFVFLALAKRFGVVPQAPILTYSSTLKGPISIKITKEIMPVSASHPLPPSLPRSSIASSVAKNSFDKSDPIASIHHSPSEYKLLGHHRNWPSMNTTKV